MSDGPPPDLTDVYFVTAQTGFGVTANGGIYRSSDGGATWQIRFRRGGARFFQVVFSDANTGMALGTSDCLTLYNNCEGPAILARTSDGGDSWDVIEPGAPTPGIASALPFLTIAIVSPKVSYAVRDPDQQSFPIDGFANGLLATNDGGIHWRSVPLPQKTYAMGGISFLSPAQGYITTWREDTKEYQVLATTDGGQHWGVRYSDPAFPLYAVQFLDAQHGFAGGGWGGKPDIATPPTEALLATDDGGTTWHLVYHRDDPRGGLRITRLHFGGLAIGWSAVGGCNSLGGNGPCGGSLRFTTDGGRTWTVDPSHGKRTNVVRFSSISSTAWIAPGGGEFARTGLSILDRTTDGGATWQTFWRPEALTVSHIQFVNPQVGWMDTNVGFFQTRDSGAHWTSYALGAPVVMEDRPVFASESVVLAMRGKDPTRDPNNGGDRELVRSEDGGKTWQSVSLVLPPNVSRGVPAIAFAGPDNGWLTLPIDCNTGDCPIIIFATTDGGRTWQQRSTPLPVNRASLAFGDTESGTLIGVGDRSQDHVLITMDGGRTWDEQPLPRDMRTGSEINGIAPSPPSVLNEREIWFADSVGSLIHSKDAGRHWIVSRLDGIGFITQVRFVSQSDGWLIASYVSGGSASLFVTHNDGQDWQQVWPEISLS
ncbi:MAG: WD40/YVTN/BNR-like repeat-containing protein [Thermomicrobiales bacterium]